MPARGKHLEDHDMTRNAAEARDPDRDLIDIQRENEVREWSRSLGCSDAQLLEAVRAVGNSAVKVRDYLRRG